MVNKKGQKKHYNTKTFYGNKTNRKIFRSIKRKLTKRITKIGRVNVQNESADKIRMLKENDWLEPFTNTNRNTPTILIDIDGVKIEAVIDTGATRIMCTSQLAKKIWGNDYGHDLKPYGNRVVQDAQGNEVKVLGYKNSKIQLGKLDATEYPIVIYEANHSEILIGYTYLADNNLNIYCGKGIGSSPKPDVVKRLNYKEEPMECFLMADEEIPAGALKTVEMKVKIPKQWTNQDKMMMIGHPVIVHSEDIEKKKPTELTCPYTYDILEMNLTVHAVVDNTRNHDTLVIKKDEMMAHAELAYDQPSNDQIKRIIKEGTYDFETESLPGELKLEKEEKPGRYEYIEKVNIKSKDPGVENFCKTLLKETEQFWSKSTYDLGKFDRKAKITMKTTTPVRDKYRPIHPDKEKRANEIIEQLERHKIITKANSPYCSCPVWTYKAAKDAAGKQAIAGAKVDDQGDKTKRDIRLALDYRRVNKNIASVCHWPNPSIKDLLYKLKSAKYVSIIDLTNSYWNIELTDETKPIFAFQTATAQYQFERLPQGCSPAMGIMAEAVTDTIMNGGIADICSSYVDNIMICSSSLETHKRDLHRVIMAFLQRGWKANAAKSHLVINDQLRLFGFHVDLANQTIAPDPQKVEAMQGLPPPHNQKSARSFCGMANYYLDIVPNLGQMLSPIHEVTKDGKFVWTQQCQENFELIKAELKKLPIVHLPDFNKEFHLFTDAAISQHLSYHISQYRQDMNKYVPLCYGSHKFNKHEKNMSQPESELFAIVFALSNESLLLGFSKIIVHTDCKSLTYLGRFSKICSKLARWQLVISSFDIEIEYQPADSHQIVLADMLTRRPGHKMVNRRPKLAEIEELPDIKFKPGKRLTMQEVKMEIDKQLKHLPPISPETIRYISEKYTPPGLLPQQLRGNQEMIFQLAQSQKIEHFEQTKFPNKFVITPEELHFKKDVSPSGRLINLVLQEAPGMSIQNLKYYQLLDPVFGPIMKKMMETGQPEQDYVLKTGILLKKSKTENEDFGYQICVPKSLSLQLIAKFHFNVFSGHPDLKKMMTNLKKRFYIKNLKNEVQMVIKSCQICTLNKSYSKTKQPFGTKIPITGPRQCYAMDIATVDYKAPSIDPELKSSFLIITDAWTLFTIAIPISSNPNSQEILEKFAQHIIQPFGKPTLGICTDGGKNFSSSLSNAFSAILGIKQYRISPYNARANPAERVNRAIISGLRFSLQQFQLSPDVFKSLLNYIVLAWNTSVLSHINFSPYQLFLSTNYEPAAFTSFVTIQEAERSYNDFLQNLIKTQTLIENLVNKRFQSTRDKRYKKQLEHSKHSAYAPGMQVMIKKKIDETQRAHKLRPRWIGPFKIIHEYQNNIEVIPWDPEKRTQFIDKYKNECKNIPKFEKYLISKDRVKPITNLAYYYDDNLARRFYQEFWDAIRDVEPIKNVELCFNPTNSNPHPLHKTQVTPHQLKIQYPSPMQKKINHKTPKPSITTKKDDESLITEHEILLNSNKMDKHGDHGSINDDNDTILDISNKSDSWGTASETSQNDLDETIIDAEDTISDQEETIQIENQQVDQYKQRIIGSNPTPITQKGLSTRTPIKPKYPKSSNKKQTLPGKTEEWIVNPKLTVQKPKTAILINPGSSGNSKSNIASTSAAMVKSKVSQGKANTIAQKTSAATENKKVDHKKTGSVAQNVRPESIKSKPKSSLLEKSLNSPTENEELSDNNSIVSVEEELQNVSSKLSQDFQYIDESIEKILQDD